MHTCLFRNIAIQPTKHNIHLILEVFSSTVLHHQLAQLFAHGQALLPLHGIAVLLAGRPRTGAHSREREVWVQCEKEDEALADTTCRTEDACCDLLETRVISWFGCVPTYRTSSLGSRRSLSRPFCLVRIWECFGGTEDWRGIALTNFQ